MRKKTVSAKTFVVGPRVTTLERRFMRLLGSDTVQQLDLALDGESDADALA
jgi:hypothetical protein